MAKLLKLRRGTTSQHSSFTGAEGEVTVDTDKDTVVVHNGSTAGGIPLAKESALAAIATDLVNDTSPQLGANLDVNTKNILVGDSADGDTDDVIKFGAGTDLSIYSDGTNGTFLIPDTGTLLIKQGSSTLTTFSGASNQVDFHEDVIFIGAASNGMWDKSANKFVANVQGDLTGTASTATEATNVTVVANNSADETVYPTFVDGATGTQGIETDTGFTYNPSTGNLTSTVFTGNLTGNVTGNTSGSSGSCTGNAATATTSTNVTVADESSDTSCNVLFTTAATGDLPPKSGTNLTFNSSTGDLAATILTDGKGNVRSIPQNTQGGTYTLVAADAGKHILASGTVTVPDSVFSAGDAVTIVNNTGSDLTITKTITTMYNASDGSSANRTLANRGMATIIFVSGTVAYISGAGLS